MIRGITNLLKRREQIGKESLDFQQVRKLLYSLDRQTIVTVSEPNAVRTTNPLDAIDTALEQLMPFGKNYFDAEHEIFLDKNHNKEFHYLDMSIGQLTEKGEKMMAFYRTTVSYNTKHPDCQR